MNRASLMGRFGCVVVLVLAAGPLAAQELEVPESGPPPLKGPLNPIDNLNADDELNELAVDLLGKVGLKLFKGAIVTSVRAQSQAVDAPATAPSESVSAYSVGKWPSMPFELEDRRLTELDVTVACTREPARVQLFYDEQMPNAKLWLRDGKRRYSMLIRSDQADRSKRVATPEKPAGPRNDIQVLIRREKSTGQERTRWRARLELLRWRHMGLERKWILGKLDAAKKAEFLKALEPADEHKGDLIFLAKGQWKAFRPTDLDAKDLSDLRDQYRAVFDKFAPQPMPETPRLRSERMEIVGLRTALAQHLFVHIRVKVPAAKK